MALHAENPQLYLAAEYWFAKPGDEAELSPGRLDWPPAHITRFAHRVLRDYFDGTERGQLRRFFPGETFDPGDQSKYLPGTIVALSREVLRPKSWNRITWGTVEPPLPCPDLTLSRNKDAIGRTAIREYIDGADYERSTRWGVVVPPARKFSENTLLVAGLWSSYGGFVTPGTLFTGPFTIGKTERTLASLWRINALEICTNGKTQKEQQGVFDFARGWLARLRLST